MPAPIQNDLERIKKFLPHRSPFLFVDQIAEFEAGVRITARKHLDPEADFFKGHFPGHSLMPGVLVAEALAQTSGLLMGLTHGTSQNMQFVLAQVNVKFSQPAFPGDTLTLFAKLAKTFGRLFRFDVTATVGNRMIAKGSLMLAKADDAP